ncbi:MAG: hypothetical protein ACXAD7_04625 [Candidatus Kariarchaeaceae archaeon]|jgi:hypothetical protein
MKEQVNKFYNQNGKLVAVEISYPRFDGNNTKLSSEIAKEHKSR